MPVITSFPVLSSIKWGQISLWLTVLCWYSFKTQSTVWFFDRPAGACKMYPMFYLIFHLLEKRVQTLSMPFGFRNLWFCLPLAFLPLEQIFLYYETSFLAGNLIKVLPSSRRTSSCSYISSWFIDGQHMIRLLPPLIIEIPKHFILFFSDGHRCTEYLC